METTKLKRFAQFARRSLIEQVSAKLKLVLAEDSAARREQPNAVAQIEKEIFGISGRYLPTCPLIPEPCPLVERVAYIWFNRFCALRFMDVNRYNRVGIVSPADPGQFQPEILAEAKMGHIDEEMVHDKIRQQIFALLDGKAPSRDPQGEAYRLLVVAACNYWNKAMPFLFERIEDYTELLMPDDLLSGNSILSLTREAMTPETCEDVEVIGWLYQFYISEKKDQVFDGLKKNKKITPENIPAATQLFTPHWIVRYLVENSLGRLWMLNRPNSPLKERMEYYIEPQKDLTTENTENTEGKDLENSVSSVYSVVEKDFLVVNSPEEIKICDPACGSGHMLTYAFDLLYAIYEEEGYEPAEIPEKILTHNLYGIEIDERAGELAAFALTMKARAKQRRFFNKGVKPNICVLEKVDLTTEDTKSTKEEYFLTTEYTDDTEWKMVVDAMVKAGVDREALIHDLGLFTEADNFGSLLRPRLNSEQAQKALNALMAYDKSVKTPTFGHYELMNQCQQALRQADYLSPKYHVVIANPPYMGGKGMNGRLATWVKDNYPNSKSDLFAMFIERNLDLAKKHGAVAMITMQSWMFLSSFEALRARLLGQNTLLSMAHLGARAFDSIGGEVVSTTAFVLKNANRLDYKGGYLRLVAGNSEAEKNDAIREAVKNLDCGWFYRASAAEFKKIPGSPIAYWVSENTRLSFTQNEPLSNFAFSDGKNITGNNDKFQRYFWEVSSFEIGVENRWVFISKGGGFKKWTETKDVTIDWSQSARNHYRKNSIGRIISEYIWFRKGISWGLITSSLPSFRALTKDFTFSDVGIFFNNDDNISAVLAFLNSKIAYYFLNLLNPTLNYPMEMVLKLPVSNIINKNLGFEIANKAQILDPTGILHSEISWDFTSFPLLSPDYRQPTLKATYQKLCARWQEMTLEMQRLEEENNRIFIDAYGLQDELTHEVPLNEITLTCNPHYRYGNDKSEDELEALLLADTLRELVSYAVGCMFGRYSLDKPGLILANQGETREDFYKKIGTTEYTENTEKDNANNSVSSVCSVVKNSFKPDKDNVIPMLDGDWFTDDISERFKQFLKVAFGAEHYEENLRFVENALGKDIRKYFLKDFYSDHVKRYKKRPIYWLFSSPKGSFNALIYMHRYRPDTVSVVLNDYLREFRTKLTAHKNHLEAVSISASAAPVEKTKALKEIEKITKMIAELAAYEREVLYPLATQQINIDLDDGVKANYPKFGAALKKIPGLGAVED